MSQFQVKTLEDAGRATTVWSNDVFDSQPRLGDVVMALLPASLILAAATALLVALF